MECRANHVSVFQILQSFTAGVAGKVEALSKTLKASPWV